MTQRDATHASIATRLRATTNTALASQRLHPLLIEAAEHIEKLEATRSEKRERTFFNPLDVLPLVVRLRNLCTLCPYENAPGLIDAALEASDCLEMMDELIEHPQATPSAIATGDLAMQREIHDKNAATQDTARDPKSREEAAAGRNRSGTPAVAAPHDKWETLKLLVQSLRKRNARSPGLYQSEFSDVALAMIEQALETRLSATATHFACEGEGLTMRCPSQCEACAKKAAAALRLLRGFPGHAFENRYNGWLNERDALLGNAEYVSGKV